MFRITLLLCTVLSLGLLVRAAIPEPTAPTTDFQSLLQPGSHTLTFPVNGQDRTVFFQTPKGFKPGQPLPIVFCFHGAGGGGEQAARIYGWIGKAEAENFFLAAPQGLAVSSDAPASFMFNPHIWRDGETAERQTPVIDDFHFFEVLLDQLKATLPIDPKRVYMTGFSNGAGMTMGLGARFADRIAAIAPLSTPHFGKIDGAARALPIYYAIGTADPLVPYNGGTTTTPWGTTRTTASIPKSIEKWAVKDGCPMPGQEVPDVKGVKVLRYGPGTNGAVVVFTTVEGNGHHWPGSKEPLPASIVGPSLDPFQATDRIWDFFKANALP